MAKPIDQLNEDFKKAVTGGVLPKAGDSMNWGGGTLARTADNRLQYKGNNYETYIDANTDPTALAKAAPGIRQQWATQYGVDLGSNPETQGATTNAINNLVTGGVAPGTTFQLGSNGLGNYSVSAGQNGALNFNTPGGMMSWDQFKQSNDYKALTGLNPNYAPPAPAPGMIGGTPTSPPGTPTPGTPAPGTPAPQGNAASQAQGLISQQVTAAQPTSTVAPPPVTQATTTTANATTREVGANETVQGQLDQLLKKGNPLYDKAVAKSTQAANERGLMNSSMAGEAGVSALLDSALSIASPDAAAYQTAARDNQSVLNQNSQFNATAQNQGSQFNATAQNDRGKQLLQGQQDISKIRETGAQEQAKIEKQGNVESGLQLLKNQGLMQTAQVEAQYKALTQASASASAIMSNLQTVYNAVQTNPDLDAASKQAIIKDNVAIADRALKVIGAAAGDINLSTYLDGILGG